MNMNSIVGTHHILFITLDTLRYDVADALFKSGRLPTIAQYAPTGWEKRHSPATFTYAAHHAYFSGFLPMPENTNRSARLFAGEFEGSVTVGDTTFIFNDATWPEGLAKLGYRTLCVGGVGFFNKKSALGNVLPSLFETSVWNPSMGVADPDSTKNQVDFVVEFWKKVKPELCVTFVNVSAIHQPNNFYSGCRHDSILSHAEALIYVDLQLKTLFEECGFLEKPTFTILTSDHGTCYGEDGIEGHRYPHPVVWTVPYTQFIIQGAL
jgi:hypothetical protein